YNFVVEVSDTLERFVVASLSITISEPSAPLTITTTSLSSGTVGLAYSRSLAATGGKPPYSWSLAQGSLPAGLSLNTTTGLITGTPTVAGTVGFVARVQDSADGSAVRTLSITISASTGPLTISTTSLSSGVVGQPYSAQVTATGGSQPYAWLISQGALPGGLQLNSSGGLIFGTPTTAGVASFTVRVQDAQGASATRALSITISPATSVLTIVTDSLPDGVLGQAYNQQVIGSGGTQPYNWSVPPDDLPAGLTLDRSTGSLGGAPQATGTFVLRIRLTDSVQQFVTKNLILTIGRASANLQFTTSRLTFEGFAGGTAPPAQAFAVISGSQSQPYTLQLDSGPPGSSPPVWMKVSPLRGTTPQRINVAVDITSLPVSRYLGRILTTGATGPIVVEVELIITARSSQLTASPGFLRFAGTRPSLASAEQPILVSNGGGAGSIAFRAASTAPWLRVSPASATANPAAVLTVRVEPGSLKAGAYTAQIDIASAAGNATVVVTLLIRADGPVLSLDVTGVRFVTRAGQGNPPSQTVNVLNLGEQAVNFRTEIVEGRNWLSLSPSSGRATTSPVAMPLVPNAASLAPGAYYALVRVFDDAALNSPQYLVAVLEVRDGSSPVEPEVTPGGLVYVLSPNAPASSQSVRIWAGTLTSLGFQTSVFTRDGANWLSTTPSSGNVSSQQSITVNVIVNTAGLAPGVYRGEVSFALGAPPVRSVNVTLIVPRVGASTSSKSERSLAGCTPASAVATFTSLANGFSSPVSWPTPLTAQVSDNCGDPVPNGRVTISFSNGDPTLSAGPSNPARGIYSATWAPVSARSPVSLRLEATVPNLTSDVREISGDATANQSPAPTVSRGAVVNPFYRVAGSTLAPGTLVEIYGTNLTSVAVEPKILPLPRVFNNTSVIIGGTTAPLFFLSPGQLNVQLPYEFAPNSEFPFMVSRAGTFSLPETLVFSDVQPGVFAFAQKADASLVTAESPAKPGEFLQLYLLGMGVTNPPVASGVASPGTEPLGRAAAETTVTVGGVNATIYYVGLTPGLVGLFQINVQVPTGLSAGEYDVVVTTDGRVGNSFKLSVRP
ncbi:MAG: putative Ig domain-containing protein, partial [Bryobacteraceae bacterium]